ncbi:MAG: hypothetical protein IKA03_06595 [Alphaproteobacteria bacterium]|nr:hypothetical protein [Alphaproteobacteria bacterium]
MEKQFKNTLMEIFIFTEGLNSCPSPLQEEKIQLIIKAAIKRTHCRAFSRKGASKRTQESVLAMLKILEARPRIKSMEYLDIEKNIEKINNLKKIRAESGWFKSILLSFKINSLYDETYLLEDIISGLKVRYPDETIAAIEQVRDDVEYYTFLEGEELI